MRLLAVISKLTGVSTNVEASEVTLNAPSIVKLSAERSDISQLARVNQDLVITFTSGEKLTVKNFYVANDQGTANWCWKTVTVRCGGWKTRKRACILNKSQPLTIY